MVLSRYWEVCILDFVLLVVKGGILVKVGIISYWCCVVILCGGLNLGDKNVDSEISGDVDLWWVVGGGGVGCGGGICG